MVVSQCGLLLEGRVSRVRYPVVRMRVSYMVIPVISMIGACVIFILIGEPQVIPVIILTMGGFWFGWALGAANESDKYEEMAEIAQRLPTAT
jgi:hypothetical protein